MLLSDFDYHLPDQLVAQAPLAERAGSRMLVVDRVKGTWEDATFLDLPRYLRSGDCLALNNTRVFPARLLGQKEGYHRAVEVFLLRPETPDRLKWRALVRPGRQMHPGTEVTFSPALSCLILESGVRGERLVEFRCTGDIDQELSAVGHIPLPPYIHRSDEESDRERYQTVFAEEPGSVAAPTAGLHFTPEVLSACQQAGADLAKVTLHVGLGTFQPLSQDEVEANQLHHEHFELSAGSAAALNAAQRRIAVGTTTVRTLESVAATGPIREYAGDTNLFIYPGYQFRAVDAMLTNFHLPKSSLLLLVCAFGGRDLILDAYRHAVEAEYRFFSYGDCMLIL